MKLTKIILALLTLASAPAQGMFNNQLLDLTKDIANEYPITTSLIGIAYGSYAVWQHYAQKKLNIKLINAAEKGTLDDVKECVRQGANINAQNHLGDTPIYKASYYGKFDIVDYLLDMNALVNSLKFDAYTPLYRAIEYNRLDIVQRCVDKGADICLLDTTAHTPLHNAANRGRVDMVQYFINKGIKVNVQDVHNKKTALHYACKSDYGYFNFNAVDCLVKNGADTNIQDATGYTPLHYAAKDGHYKTTKYLIQHSARANITTHKGDKAYDFTLMFANAKLPAYLDLMDRYETAREQNKMNEFLQTLTVEHFQEILEVIIARVDRPELDNIATFIINNENIQQQLFGTRLRIKNKLEFNRFLWTTLVDTEDPQILLKFLDVCWDANLQKEEIDALRISLEERKNQTDSTTPLYALLIKARHQLGWNLKTNLLTTSSWQHPTFEDVIIKHQK